MIVRWTNKAKQDMENLVCFIAADDLDAALRVQDAIFEHAELLADNPNMAKPGRVKNTRELVNTAFPNYILVYMIREETVIILRVLHARKQWPPELTLS